MARDLCHSLQRVAPFCMKSESRFQEQKQSDPMTREKADKSSLNPVSSEIISDSVEL